MCACCVHAAVHEVCVGVQWWWVPGKSAQESVFDLGEVPGSQIYCRQSNAFLHQQLRILLPVIGDLKIKKMKSRSRAPHPDYNTLSWTDFQTTPISRAFITTVCTHTPNPHSMRTARTQALGWNQICNAFLCPRIVHKWRDLAASIKWHKTYWNTD